MTIRERAAEAAARAGGAVRVPRGGALRVWLFVAVMVALALALYMAEVRTLQPIPAPIAIPWGLLALMFFVAEVKVVHFHFRRDAHSLSLNEIRRRKREWARNAPLEDAAAFARSAPTSDPFLREKVMEAVNDLPPGCRIVFMMHDAEGYTHQEIAAALGVTVGSSKAQLSRARGKLRVALAMFAEEWGQ